MRTLSAKTNEVDRDWHVVDATDQPLGRLASKVASVLRGKHRPDFTPHADAGDFVVVINADKVKLTGNKLDKKFYHRHSGYPGGIKSTTYRSFSRSAPRRPSRRPCGECSRRITSVVGPTRSSRSTRVEAPSRRAEACAARALGY